MKHQRRDGNDPFNEAFSFAPDQYELFKKLRPDLFDRQTEPRKRSELWKRFANTSIGKAFRRR